MLGGPDLLVFSLMEATLGIKTLLGAPLDVLPPIVDLELGGFDVL